MIIKNINWMTRFRIKFRLPLRAGRGVPIAQGPAEERKARGWE